MDDKRIEESNRTPPNANPYLPPDAGDDWIDASHVESLRETVSSQLSRMRNRAILLAINLGLMIGVLIVLFLTSRWFSSASWHEDLAILGVPILAMLAAEFFLFRLIFAHSRAIPSPELTDLATACEAEARCVKAGALIILSVVGVFITVAFME